MRFGIPYLSLWGGREIRKKVVETEIQTGRCFKRMVGAFIDKKVDVRERERSRSGIEEMKG